MRRLAQGAWLAVPAIGKRVSLDLSSPALPGWQAVQHALSLPELRAFGETAARLAIDATAPSAEWTSTCVVRQVRGGDAPLDQIVHSPYLKMDNGAWVLTGSDPVPIQTMLPPSGWVRGSGNGPWYDYQTGLPIETTESLDKDPDALNETGYSYFWAPDPVDGITVVIRECERLQGQVMDICAAMDPAHSHPDIRLREWRSLEVI